MRYRLYRKAWKSMVSICPDIYNTLDDDNETFCRLPLPSSISAKIRSIGSEEDDLYTYFKHNEVNI